MQTKELTFEDLVALEPRLGQLLKDVKRARPHNKIKAMHLWYREYKQQMVDLVGMMSKHPDPILHTSRAYNLCYEVLYKAIGAE